MSPKQNPASAIRFVWKRNIAGYRWLGSLGTNLSAGELALVPTHPKGEQTNFTPSPQAYLEFARTVPSRSGIWRFANENGLLGEGAARVYDEHGVCHENAELLSTWSIAIAQMSAAVDLHGRIQKGAGAIQRDIEVLKHKVVYRGTAYLGGDYKGALLGVVESPSEREIARDQLDDPNDPIPPAEIFLERAVNAQLENTVRVRLYRIGNSWGRIYEPGSLLAFLWLQFLEAIMDGRGSKECANPKCRLPISPNKEACDANCRMQVYLGKIDEAHALRSKGKTPKEIAEELGVRANRGNSAIEVVRLWLRKQPRKSATIEGN